MKQLFLYEEEIFTDKSDKKIKTISYSEIELKRIKKSIKPNDTLIITLPNTIDLHELDHSTTNLLDPLIDNILNILKGINPNIIIKDIYDNLYNFKNITTNKITNSIVLKPLKNNKEEKVKN